MKGRARRILDKMRMKERAKRLRPQHSQAWKYADNLKVCSCHMCGNPRRYYGEETLQEQRQKYVPTDATDPSYGPSWYWYVPPKAETTA